MFDNKFKEKINNILKSDGVIAFVTDTVWGIGCLPNNKKAVDKIYEIKGRDRSKPLILMSNNIINLEKYVEKIPSNANNLIEKYFPGALTLVLKKSVETPDFITSNFDTVGIRVPDNNTFLELLSIIDGNVLATTSANKSNKPSAKTFFETKENIGDLVDLVIEDFGNNCKGQESTVVLVNEKDIKILRQGSLSI